MRIAIIGTGKVGSALGGRWAALGHSVIFGSREPQSPKVVDLLQSIGNNVEAASPSDAVANAEVVVLATPWTATEAAIQACGNLAGKVMIDTVNPIKDRKLDVGFSTSAAEMIAGWAPGAKVVKAFNSTGAANMANPDYGGIKPTMFICGDDPAAKAVVATLVDEIGFEAVDTGRLEMARALEPLVLLWVGLAVRQGLGPGIAFKLLRKR